MPYKHRFYYAFVMLIAMLLAGGLYDTVPHLMEMEQLQMTAQQLLQQITQAAKHANNHALARLSVPATQAEIISSLTLLAYMNTVHVTAINLKTPSTANTFTLGFSALGELNHLTAFLGQLGQQSAVNVQNFSYKLMQDKQIHFTTDLLVDSTAVFEISKLRRQLLVTENPFCVNPVTTVTVIEESVPLAQVKMVGFMQSRNQKVALVALPNQVNKAVTLGTVIGKEQAVVKAIFPSGMVLALKDHSQLTIMR